jgi:hypothetical protein
MAKITINGISLDPTAQAMGLDSAGLHSVDSSASNYVLIQTKAPLNRAQKEELRGLGVEILEYVPVATYVCHYPSSDLDAIRALPYVEWANVYLERFKVAPQLLTPSGKTAAADLLADNSPETSMSQEPRSV